MYTILNPPNEDCREGGIKPVIHGKFYIPGQLEANIPNVGYQADSAVPGQERIRGQQVSGSEESWQRLHPVVECGDDAMTLTVRRRRAVQLLLNRVNESSVPLSQLPPHCGYSVQTTWRDLSLMAQYDACHVTQEDDSYVLPLLWRGTPVKMSCPASLVQPQAVSPPSSPSPPSLCCSPYGMTVTVQGLSTEELKINVRGEWTPLVLLAERCGYTLDRRDADIVIAAPFIACGITVKVKTLSRPITNLKPLLHQQRHRLYDVHHGPLHPYYYYYHLYNQPKVPTDDQESHPAGGTNSKSESQLPTESDYSEMGRLVQAAESGYLSMPQSDAFHSLYSHYLTWQHPYPDGEDADKRLDDEMEDQLKANLYTPSASPCGLGRVSDFDCSLSSGCCSYSVKDCTMGQYLMFVVPDSVTEPTLAPTAQPSEVSNVSCTLQRLTSDPDIYTVPLDGCGVNKHVFGQTAVHLLEVHGIYSLQQDHSPVQENSPVRLMVECSSSPGSPGEVRLYMMDQPPPPPVQSTPATVRVQLRIATDESFTSFHPEAHLPLSIHARQTGLHGGKPAGPSRA
ncbi:hypothetical protein D5F01_LYC18280 [Larimichthys crocea]|uniref:Uncharacterized protein n=1 Tax=Larimichthys crocea TaxID=215358 RepID=A0A6G0HUF0_LARCR|nr:hypothetical protein D5F01_LYC18280 [Larimichthys crocea]